MSASHAENEANANKQYVYDPLGRLQTVTEGTGPTARVTSYGYDSDDNLTSVVDADGRLTSYLYDDFGQLTAVDSPDSGLTLYQYDALGNLVAKLEPGTPVVLTDYAYDTLGRLSEQLASLDGVPASTVAYGYDSLAGSDAPPAPVSETCADGPRTFDPQGLAGRLVWVRHETGTTYYSYHPLGEVTEVFEQPGTSASICYWSIVHYSHDGLGRLTSVTYPSGRVVSYAYDAGATRPTSVILTLEVLGASVDVTLLSSIGYDVDGSVTSFSADSMTLSATRDYAGQPLRRLYAWSGEPRFDWSIDGRDQVGNIEQVSDASSSRVLAVGYDDAYRVTSAAGAMLRGYQDCDYTYDDAG
ncbi:MAG: RHS repeat protein, partial [Deltaproteobacteria bacterium]|nr:RHS repeat protein [Deltaproteobacteria bacterium]